VRIIGERMPPADRGAIPLPYYILQRLDTGEIAHRRAIDVMMLALRQRDPAATEEG
jgi:hypothetical protein